MAKGKSKAPTTRKRKRPDEDVDLGVDDVIDSFKFGDEEEEKQEPETEDIPEEDTVEPEKPQPPPPTDFSRILPEDEDVNFKGTVYGEDLPKCGCCGKSWNVNSQGIAVSPGCGCCIHPSCPKCNCCVAHCTCRK